MREPTQARTRMAGMATAGVLCLVYIVLRPPSQDFASGDFRAHLFRRGAYLWNNLWFGGHPLPGYGLVSPMLSGVFGVVPVAVASVLVATWCFTMLVERWWETHPSLPDPVLSVVLFACGCGVNLWGGRLTFGPAVMFGTACVLALQRDRRVLVVLCAALCGLSSPVGALSLVIVLSAVWIANAAPRGLLVVAAAATVVPIGLLILAFPEGGWYPFTWGSLTWLTTALAVVGWFGRDIRMVRWAAVIYGVVAIGAFLVESPLGGNVVRLGWLVAGPAAALSVRKHRRVVVPVFAAFSLIWSWSYVKMAFLPADQTASAEYYDSLAEYLHTLPQPLRVEVVPTSTFGQADQLALQINGIARGWETQIDRELNPVFYGGALDTSTFHQWLLDHAVSVVALPLGGVQDKSHDEEAIIRSEPSYLRPVWSNQDWRVYRVRDASPLADNGATVTDVQPESLTIRAPRAGWTEVKFRFTSLYQVSTGSACIDESPDGWIRLLVQKPGTIRLTVALSPDQLLNPQPDCA
jgi:hypothetical protein